MNPKVSIIMGSTSDLQIMEAAADLFEEFEIPFEDVRRLLRVTGVIKRNIL